MDKDKQTDNPTRRQFKMQLDDEFLTALESCSNRFGRRSTQAAAEEILTLYFPHWKRAGEIALDVPHDVNGPVEEVAIS